MDQVMSTAGSYWFNKKAGKELSAVGSDINSISSSIEGGAKWFVNKVKGKMQKPLAEVLQEYDLPLGLFPQDATNYEFDEATKYLTVCLPMVCEVCYKDSSVVRFFTTVSGYLEKGQMTHVSGMKTKIIIWTKVIGISTDVSKIHFSTALKNTSRSRDAYNVVRDGVVAEKY